MKFYISSRVKEKSKSQALRKNLEALGHSITFDWMNYSSTKPYRDNWKESAEASKKMIEGIKQCDVFILFSDSGGGTGMYVELGVALSENKRVFVVGKDIEKPIFMFHSNVTHVYSVEELFKVL